MDINKCKELLLNRVLKAGPWDSVFADRIVGSIFSRYSYPQIRQYVSGPDKEIWFLIAEAESLLKPPTQPLRQLPSLQPPPPGHQFPWPHCMPQFQPSGSYHGMQVPSLPIGQIGAFQRQHPESIFSDEHLQSLSFPGDGMPRNSLNAGPSVIRYPPSSSTSHTRPCHFHFNGHCKKGVNCRFFHGSGVPEVHNQRQGHYLGSLFELEMETRAILIAWRPSPVPVENLPMRYLEMYGKPLLAEGCLTESQRHGKAVCSLTCLLMRFKKTRVLERQHGQYYVILEEDAHNYLDCLAWDLKDAGSGSNQIFMTFPAESNFTKEDVQNHFKKYGPVKSVLIPHNEMRTFGFVRFLYTETVRMVLSEKRVHFIRGARVLIKPYMEHKRGKLAQVNDLSQRTQCGNVSNEHRIHTGDNTTEISHVPDGSDEA